jgi:hypothetical protein
MITWNQMSLKNNKLGNVKIYYPHQDKYFNEGFSNE